ncbi:hypothetical protein HBH64_127620 [Parastagonospora nodorum]|nr:hypothetical protein HBI01_138320 [Parastagonospora nodorum]KAH4308882.1 hypothetical protein HBI02_102420 [Parastagonospora nodorum]KAH4328741.1 hypothetical protein HBI00_106180 [Parastagonospora nodorum]KAH4375882.1 hypothetical protein HBH94_093030 [Parastagonospora nodorum]KAH4467846.1 hypothetical protein HBH90_087140 [Parastagonospora nodorum]
MKLQFTISTLLGLSLCSPTPAYAHLPTVRIRTIGPDNTHYTSSNQSPSVNGHIITLPIGIALSSLAQHPLLLQGFEIVDAEVEGEVFCRVNIGYSSKGIEARKGDEMVMLDSKGGVVTVTGLTCGTGSGSA